MTSEPRRDPGAEIPALAITSKAVEMVKKTREQEGMGRLFGLRVAVMGGGCSGFQYALDFEQEARPPTRCSRSRGSRSTSIRSARATSKASPSTTSSA